MIPQKFIVAVSGGVDSVVLLHILMHRKPDNVTYIVAHFDHGMREDSHKDAEFVALIAKNLQLAFESGAGKLGANASEEQARNARYAFLRRIKDKYQAEKVITAHHQDDLIETIIMNMLRGTSPRGLNPMQGQTDILRPLMNRSKDSMYAYAKTNKLTWREDPSNSDEKYMRNHVRTNLASKLSASNKETFVATSRKINDLYQDIDARIDYLLPSKNVLYRPSFVVFSYAVQRELIRAWLQRSGLQDIDRKLIERLVIACKTLPIGKKIDVDGRLWLTSEKENILLVSK
jgi:tRNA(Ile)-lysidine synthetase-like protein